ncbi:MAG: PAS domain S-box protein [Myxococcales bacterium]|nr:PAS domain S-box protein [Myxococcales bacterium]
MGTGDGALDGLLSLVVELLGGDAAVLALGAGTDETGLPAPTPWTGSREQLVGVPLDADDADTAGLLCVARRGALEPRELELLTRLARQASAHLERLALARAQREAPSIAPLLEEVSRMARIGGWEFDPETGRGTWTAEVARIHGVDPNEPTHAARGLSFIAPPFRPLIEAAIVAAIQDGEPYDLEVQLQPREGELKWVRTIATPVMEAGRVVKLQGTMQDITELKLAQLALLDREAALAQSEAQLRSLVDGLAPQLLVALTTPDGTIVELSQAALDAIGLPRSELANAKVYELGPWAADAEAGERLKDAVVRGAAGETTRFDVRLPRSDGKRIDFDLSCQPIRHEGEVVSLVLAASDVTARASMERRLKELARMYALWSEINHAIMREGDAQAMLTTACRLTVDVGELSLACVSLTRPGDGAGKIVAAAGRASEAVEAVTTWFEEDRCPLAREVIETRRAVVVPDLLAHPATRRLVERESRWRGSAAVLPLVWEGEVVGIYAIHADHADAFGEDSLRLLQSIAVDVVFALTVKEQELARRRAEAALRDSEERFRELAEHVNDVFWIADRDRAVVHYVSPAYARVWGRPLADATTQPWEVAIHPDDRERVTTALQDAKDRGSYDVEYRIVRPDGGVRWLHDAAFAVTDGDGSLARLVGVARDITRRRRIEQELRVSEAKLASAATLAKIGHFSYDPATELFEFNDGFYETMRTTAVREGGYTMSATDYFNRFCKPEVAQRLLETVRKPFPDGTPEIAHRVIFGDGRNGHLLVRLLADHSDGRFRIEGVCQDVTNQRELEHQLRQAQKLEAVGRLAGGVAHDFNNILSAIVLQSEYARSETTDGLMREVLDEITDAANRAAQLTQQLLAFSSHQAMRPVELELNEQVTSLLKMLQRIVTENVVIVPRLSSEPVYTLADVSLLDQVLLNLAVNARDAMPKGGRLLVETGSHATLAADDARRGRVPLEQFVYLSVADEGEGIAAADLPHIFEPFFTRKGPGQGTGLGLATVFGIVKQHGGVIDVQSEIGKGSVFTVYLPVAEGKLTSGTRRVTKRATSGDGETILLVEDDHVVRRALRSTLARSGYRVLEAANADEAMVAWKLSEGRIDLLYTDIVMPGEVNGAELARRLLEEDPGLRVVFTSGYSADLVGDCRDLLRDYPLIQKPASPDEIIETIQLCLGSGNDEAEAG